MSRRRQEKEKEKMRKDYIEFLRWQNREQALLPLQNIETGKPGDRVLYQSLIVRFEDIQINKWKKQLENLELKNDDSDEAYTKKELEAEIKHYEKKKKEGLYELGKIVYGPVIEKINDQEKQEQQHRQQQQQHTSTTTTTIDEDEDGDVVMRSASQQSIGGKKRRKSRRKSKGRKRRRKKRTKRRKK